MIKPAYSVSFLLSINIFVWKNVLYFLDAPRIRGWVNPRAGLDGIQSPDHPVRSESLYRLHYPGPSVEARMTVIQY